MRKLYFLLLTVLYAAISNAQLTGTKTIPGDYADLNAAITDLNTQGVGAGGVTLNLLAGNPQTAPVGGYSITTITGSAANQITIQGNGNTVTASAALVAGTLNDAIFKLIGADYVTISGFTMLENAANTTTTAASNNMTEWGVALLYASTTDGAQNNTIQNNTIDLNRTYQNTFGIYSNSTHSATAVTTSATATTAAGANSGLKIYTNNITDVNIGIVIVGPTAAADNNDGLDIGGVAAGTGNNITDYGTTGTFSSYANVSGTVNGILIRNTKNFNISFNTVASSNGGTTAGTLRGIYVPSFSNAPAGTITNTINNNGVSVRSAVATGALQGIIVEATTSNATTTLNINSNNFYTSTHTIAASGAITFLSNAATALTTNVNSNTFTNLTVNTTGNVTFISNSVTRAANAVCNANSNSIVTAFNKTGAGGTVQFYLSNSTTPATGIETNNGNNFSNLTFTGATTIAGWQSTDGSTSAPFGPNKVVTNNTFTNITGGTSAITILSVSYSNSTLANNNVSGNIINTVTGGGTITAIATATASQNFFSNTVNTISTTGASAVTGIAITGGVTQNVYKNKIYDLSGSNAGSTVNGILASTIPATVNVYNNLVGDLKNTAASGTDVIRGISLTGTTATTTANVSYNTIYLNATSSGTNFGTSGIFATTSATATSAALNLRNNIVVNTSTPAGTGATVAYRRSSTTLTNYGITSNNNIFYAGTPGTANLIFSDGTNVIQTMNAYKALAGLSPRDQSSYTESPSFLSTVGSNANFLHINTAVATQAESGALPVAGITDDYDADVRNVSTPDIGADEFNGILLDITTPVISYTPLTSTLCISNRTVTATITDLSNINVASGTKPRIWFKKSTNLNVLPATNDNTTDGWKYTEATNASNPFTLNIDNSLIFGGVAAGETIQYFVVAQDLATTPNVGINSGTFTGTPSSVALTAGNFPIGGTINSYLIGSGGVSGTVTIGAAGTYPTLTGAGGLFSVLNSGGLNGNVTAEILDASITETGANALNAVNYGCGGPYTLLVKPASGVTTVLSGSATTPLIDLNGADNVTFDGSNNGSASKNMTIRNTNTSGSTFRLINDATGNTIKNTIVEGATTSATSGTIVFSTSTGTQGNSNNTISNCDIRDRSDAAGVPANAIFSSGSTVLNATNTVTGCNIFNWTNAGLLVANAGAGNGWTVSSGNFYQTSSRSALITGISIQGGSGHSVLNNNIGGTAALAGGANLATSSQVRGIDLAVGTASVTNVQGNVIKNIRSTYNSGFTASYGIFLQAGLATITGNTVGSANTAERYEINGDSYAIRVSSASAINVSNNTINNFGTNATPSAEEYYFGMAIEGAGAHSVINNTITNVTNNSTADAFDVSQTIGLYVPATGVITIRGNNISNIGSLSTTPGSGGLTNRVWGLILSATANGTVVEKNTITNVYASSNGTGTNADNVNGVQIQSSAFAALSNNIINISGGPAGDRSVFGILDLSGTTCSYNYNTISITGTATGTNSSFAFNRNVTTTVSIKNNIFSNTRTGGTGFHVAIANSNASATGWPATASNYNDIYATNSGTVAQWLGSAAGNNRTFAGWQAAQPAGSGGDANSVSAAPVFVSATDLHLSNALGANWCLNGSGIVIPGITTDIDNETRSTGVAPLGPDMGADEFTAVGDAAATPASQTIDCGAAITAITFTGSGTTFTWTRDNAGVTGIATSGTGTITGSLTNTTGAPITVTFTITPTNAGGCAGPAFTATVTVNPTPDAVATPGSQTACSGSPITTIALTSTTAGTTTYAWTRDNTGTVTGIGASGTGNISGTLTNTTAAPVTVTFTITPSSSGGCAGTPITATVTVNPLPAIASSVTQPTTCVSTDGAIDITVSGTPGPYTYVWTTSGGSGLTPGADDQTGLTVGQYTVVATDQITGCQQTAVFNLLGPGGCSICPTITTLATTPATTVCAGLPVTITASGLTSMGVTYGIQFIESLAPLANPYTGGTSIGTVANGSLGGGGTTAAITTSTLTSGLHHLYAILTPVPSDPFCRPFAEVELLVGESPTVNAVANQVVCNNGNTAAISFSGAVAGTTYNWTNTTPSIGLAGTGSGNIASFVATNSGTAPVVATVTVTPSKTTTASLSVNFAYTGAMQTWTVPAGVTSISIEALGAGGGTGAFGNASGGGISGGAGGKGSRSTGTLAVTPGQVLNIFVGGAGGTPTAGFNGGGAGGNANSGGGGGASDIRYPGTAASNRILVAGGGGGGGRGGCEGSSGVPGFGGPGGNGDGNGVDGGSSPTPGGAAGGGFGAIGDNGGVKGVGCGGFSGQDGAAGTAAGIGGDGGAGQACCCFSFPSVPGGGGGGGGFVGGGGGGGGSAGTSACSGNDKGAGGGGAGGTSYTGGVTAGSVTTNIQTGDGAVAITYSISTTCTGTPTTFTITVNPTPTVAAVTNQVVCNGSNTTAVNFTGAVTGTVYNWTNNTTSIGLAASGSGNIPSFVATNTGTTVVTATITVTPSFTNGSVTCTGTPATFTITVGPSPTVNVVANQVRCNGSSTAAITFSGAVAGTTFNWTNNTTSIGLGASGTGNIASFVATNTGTAPVVATVTVTPSSTTTGSIVANFDYTGAVQTWTVPAGVTSINIVATGAAGASGAVGGNGATGGAGGRGSRTTGTLAVTPGQVLNIFVGGTGTGNTGGFNGGGNGGSTNGGGGGGATDIRFPGATTANRILVAAGGGGGGRSGCEPNTVTGGAGGNGDGNGVNGANSPGGGGGFGAVGTTPGLKGIGCVTFLGNDGLANTAEVGGNGGNGQACCCFNFQSIPGGGGGGGGFVGGAGGGGGSAGTVACLGQDKGAGGGGAGGTSYTGGVTAGAVTTNIQTGNGTVAITYLQSITCSGTPKTFTITVNPTPTVDAVPNQVVCNNAATAAIPFSGAVTGTVYNWTNNTTSIGLAASGTGNIASFTAINTGVVPVVATITVTPSFTNGSVTCTGTPRTFTITVNPTPVVTCPGNITINAVAGTCATPVTYAATSTGVPVPTITYSIAPGSSFNVGTTTVTVTATTACGSVTCSFTVTVLDVQIPVISPVANRAACAGASATFTATSTNAASYQWQAFNGTTWNNIAGATASSYTVTNTTVSMNTNSFRVLVTGPCGTVTTSNAATLTVSPLPTVTLSAGALPVLLPNQTTTLIANANPPGGTFVWFLNGTAVTGPTGGSYGPVGVNDLGVYSVRYTDPNGCQATSANVEISGAIAAGIWVYPNPNYGQFQVRFNNQAGTKASVNVYDALGQKVYSGAFTTGSTTYSQIDIDLGLQANGVYTVEVVDGSGKRIAAKRIIVQSR